MEMKQQGFEYLIDTGSYQKTCPILIAGESVRQYVAGVNTCFSPGVRFFFSKSHAMSISIIGH